MERKIKNNINIKLSILLLFFISIFDLIPTGYTTNDDAILAIQHSPDNSILRLGYISAIEQGRIGFIWGFSFLHVPYFFESKAWYLFAKFGAIFCLAWSVYFLCKKIFDRIIGVLAAAIFIVILQNGWDHNALTSYPFAISFVGVIFIISLILFDMAIRENNKYAAVASSILLFLTFTSELFVLMAVAFVFVYFKSKNFSWIGIKENALHIGVIGLSTTIYLILYFVWRLYYPTKYDGNRVGGVDVSSAINVIFTYSISAFPFVSIKELINSLSSQTKHGTESLLNWMWAIGPIPYVKSLFAAGLVFYGCLRINLLKINSNKLFKYSFIIFVFVFIPNILLGLVDRHVNWVKSGAISYLYTYYSAVSASIFMALLFAAILKYKISWPKYEKFLSFMISIFVGVVAFATAVHNKKIANEQILSNDKWLLVDHLIASDFFKNIPDKSVISAATLTMHQKGIMAAPAEYWEAYIKKKTSKDISIINNDCNDYNNCYKLIYQQADSRDQVILIYKKENNDIYDAKKLAIFRYPSKGRWFISIPKKSIVDERDNVSGLLHVYETQHDISGIVNSSEADTVDKVEIYSNNFYSAAGVTFGVFGRMPDKLISYNFADGFYEDEYDKRIGVWNWSNGESFIIIKNNGAKIKKIKLIFGIQPINDINLRIKMCDNNFERNFFKDSEGLVNLEYSLKPGINVVKFFSSQKSVKIPPDIRFLNFRILNLRLVVKE